MTARRGAGGPPAVRAPATAPAGAPFGLGIDLDEQALARFPPRPSTGRTMPSPRDERP